MKCISLLSVFAALLFGAAVTATAQEKNVAVESKTEQTVDEQVASKRRYQVGSFRDNWIIGIAGGVNLYMGEHDRQMKFNHRLAPAMDIYVGKWFTPSLGFRVAYSGGQGFGATNLVTDLINSTGTPLGTDHLTNKYQSSYETTNGSAYKGDGTDHQALYWQEFHMWNIHADFMLNLMNLIGGYKERVYNISPYFGIGYARAYALKSNENRFCNNRLAGLVGLYNTFNICPALDITVDLRGVLVPQDFEGELGKRPEGGETYESEGYLTASVGLAYKFKPRGWQQAKNKVITNTVTNTVVDDAALNKALADNEDLKKALEEAKNDVKTEITTQIVESLLSPELFITFERNKSDLSGEAKVSLMNLAKLLNATDKSIVYNIVGYADNKTGTVERNLELSQERAQNVYDFLVKDQGVDPAHLTMDAKGGVDNMFYDDNTLSRAVILTLQK